MTKQVTCNVCGIGYSSLSSHLAHKHGITVAEYLEQYPGSLLSSLPPQEISASTREKMRYSLSLHTGGHPMRDPEFLELWKLSRSLGVYNVEAMRETYIKKIGLSHPSKDPEWVKRNVEKIIERYGKLFGGVHRQVLASPGKEALSASISGCSSLVEAAGRLGVGVSTASRWLKVEGITLDSSTDRVMQDTPRAVTQRYIDICLKHQGMISFLEVGKDPMGGSSLMNKLKRLYFSGKAYNYLFEELKGLVVSDSNQISLFLNKLSSETPKTSNQYQGKTIEFPEGYISLGKFAVGNTLVAIQKRLEASGYLEVEGRTRAATAKAFKDGVALDHPIPKTIIKHLWKISYLQQVQKTL